MQTLSNRAALQTLRKSLRAERARRGKKIISICSGSGCAAYGTEKIANALQEALRAQGLEGEAEVKLTGCHGYCQMGPIVVVLPEGIFYPRVQEEKIPQLVDMTLRQGLPAEELLYRDPATGEPVVHERDIPFYRRQHRVIMGRNAAIDPSRIEDYIAGGGYEALEKALFEMTPEEIVGQVKRSGLRGRGGGGFPTGLKWESARHHPAPRYVICNGDEGDPGAYMDGALMEANPHLILEGMLIGARALECREGYIYVRHEYPRAVGSLIQAIAQAREAGLLGGNILGSGLSFDVRISRGGGAFVCGESTALMASLEGKPGRPRAKYIHTVEKGFRRSPSVLNNVETWANIPVIIEQGAERYAALGTENSRGTKIFSLVGKVVNTGLVEVPMGTTLRRIIYEIGGGIPKGRRFKAVQTGGPSGGCIPEEFLDLPVDFDELTKVGSIMGSGGMIVMDQDTCMVDVARYFLEFLKEESCGQCNPCREGIKRMLEILAEICAGRGKPEDLELLDELARMVKGFSLCGLGTSAPNPVLTTLRYFREEYEAHVKDKHCPAGVCKALFHYEIDPAACTGCRLCARKCPREAIQGEKKQPHVLDPEACIQCGICYEACKFDAVVVR